MASPYHSKARSTQNKGVPLFSYLGYGAFGKGKGFSWKLEPVSMKMVNKLCVSDGVYTVFRKKFLLFDMALFKCFFYSRVGIFDYRATIPVTPTNNYVKVIYIHSIRNLFTTYLQNNEPQEKRYLLQSRL